LFITLLDISKLDAGAVCPSIVDFPLEDILCRARMTFAPVAEQKGLKLHIEPSTAVVRTDPALLERILFNLVGNGIRYTLNGHVRLFTSPGENTLTLTVEDTGIGIPEEYQDRIYDEFFQIAALPTRGLGLGLSIVKQSAELLGHALSLRSDPSGSSFRLEVPLVGQAERPAAAPSRPRHVSDRLSSAFVVIIDDDHDNRYAAEETYRQWGCRTLSADSEAQALSALSEHLRAPDLILTDLNLQAGRSGLKAVDAIRQHAESRIPAIILSGEADTLQLDHVPECCIVLQKPVGSERLKEASERLLLQALAAIAGPGQSIT